MGKLPLLFFLILPAPVLLASLLVGPSGSISVGDVWHWTGWLLSGRPENGNEWGLVADIILTVRLPRICLAFLAGGSLTLSGAAMQAMVRNPLVSPDILGVSAGAAFGAALSLATSWLPLQPAAFCFGLLAAALSCLLAFDRRRRLSLVTLVLAGMVIGAIFTALLTLVQIWSDPFKLQSIVHWTMGNLHTASWAKVRSALLPVCMGSAVLLLLRWRLNVLALGDEETQAVGLNPDRQKILILLPATLIAAATVAVTGIIGMVGLAAPHMTRMLAGPDNTRLLPASFLFGGTFLVLVDDFSRSAASFELPVGLFTTLIGGPFFIYLLRRAETGFRD